MKIGLKEINLILTKKIIKRTIIIGTTRCLRCILIDQVCMPEKKINGCITTQPLKFVVAC